MSEPIDLFSPKYYDGVRRPLHLAETLPGWCYASERFYQREAERIFTKTWVYVGRVERIPNAGDYFTETFATVPVIVTRDKSGRSGRRRGSQNPGMATEPDETVDCVLPGGARCGCADAGAMLASAPSARPIATAIQVTAR